MLVLAAPTLSLSGSVAEAHPGVTDGSGCHTCRTNCGRWGIPTGFYHRHGPVRSCSAQTATATPAPATPTRTPAARTPTPTPTRTPTPVAPTPTPSEERLQTSNSRPLDSAFSSKIINTDGDEVALRYSCSDDARSGSAWREGTPVTITAEGTGRCELWSIATANGQSSWVRNAYLASPESTDATPEATPATSSDQTTTATPRATVVATTSSSIQTTSASESGADTEPETSAGDAVLGLSWLLAIGVSAYVARRKGRNPWLWGVLGAVIWLIALVILWRLPSLREAPREESDGEIGPQ